MHATKALMVFSSDNCFHEGLHAETVRGKVFADSIHIPKTVADALSGMQSTEWRASIADEKRSIRDNDVMRMIPREAFGFVVSGSGS